MAAPPWRLKMLVAYLHRHGEAGTDTLAQYLGCSRSYIPKLLRAARSELKGFGIVARRQTFYRLEKK